MARLVLAYSGAQEDMDKPTPTEHLKRELKLHHMFTLSVGNIIGVSWIVMLGVWLDTAGSAGAMIAFLIGGLVIMMVGLCYAELASAFPHSGGDIVYAYELFGPGTAFAVGWVLTLLFLAVNAFLAVSAGWILSVLLPGLGGPTVYEAFGAEVSLLDLIAGQMGIVLLAVLNYWGARVAARFQSVATYALLAIAVIFIAAGLMLGDPANIAPGFTDHAGNGAAYGITMVLITTPLWYAGFNVIPMAMGERSDDTPVHHIAVALLLSIAAVMVFYILLILSASMSLPRSSLLAIDLPAAGAFEAVLGWPVMKTIVLCAGLLGLLTSWNAQFFAGTRALFALGRARLLPHFLATVSRKHGTPVAAIVTLASLSMLAALLGVGAIGRIVNTGGMCLAFLFIMVSLGLIRLRNALPHIRRPYRVYRGTTVATIAGLSATIMLLIAIWETRPQDSAFVTVEWLVILGWAVLGIITWSTGRQSRHEISEDDRKRIILGDDAD